MANITYDILDESFFTKSNYEYHLHLILADDACTYLLFDDEQVLAYRSYQFETQNRDIFSWKDELQTLIHQDNVLQLSFKTAQVLLLHNGYTFIPNQLFEEQNLSSYLNKVVSDTQNDLTRVDDIAALSLKNVYSLKIDLHRFIRDQFPTAQINHFFSPLINKLIENIPQEETATKRLFVNFHQKQMQIIYFEGKNMNFANNFEFQTANDVAYFLMLVVDQLKLNPEIIEVQLSGQIEKNTEVYNAIFRYIRNLNFVDYSLKKAKLRSFEKTQNHLFLSLL